MVKKLLGVLAAGQLLRWPRRTCSICTTGTVHRPGNRGALREDLRLQGQAELFRPTRGVARQAERRRQGLRRMVPTSNYVLAWLRPAAAAPGQEQAPNLQNIIQRT